VLGAAHDFTDNIDQTSVEYIRVEVEVLRVIRRLR